MVNFRFHVVSIIAIFLAIAIGTVMGATFVGRGVVENLQTRIDAADKTSADVRARNDELEAAADRTGKYVQQTASYAIGRALAGVIVDVVAERGVDGGTVDNQAQLLRQAGAVVPGVVWIETSWKLVDPDDRDAMRTATGLSNRAPGALRTASAGLLGRRLAAAPTSGDDVLAKLADAKFVSLSGAGGSATPVAADFGGEGARTVLLGGPSSAVPADMVPALLAGMIDGRAPVAVGEIFAGGGDVTERDLWINEIADDDALRNRLSTVDDVDRVEGRVAVTLVLAQLATGTFGNYGLGRQEAVPPNVLTTPLSR